MNRTTAVLAAAGLAAGWVGRSELERRRRGRGASFSDRLRSAFTDPGTGWTLGGLRRLLDDAEDGSRALSVTVFFRTRDGALTFGRVLRGEEPTWCLAVLGPDGQPDLIDVPEDASGLGGVA